MKVTTDRETPDKSGAHGFKHLVGGCLVEVLHPDGLHRLKHTVVGQITVEGFFNTAIVTVSRPDHSISPLVVRQTECLSLYT